MRFNLIWGASILLFVIFVGVFAKKLILNHWSESTTHSKKEIIGKLTVFSTNDLHAAIDGCCHLDKYPVKKQGHFARIGAFIKETKDNFGPNEVSLTLDAGDWSFGSLYDLVGMPFIDKDNAIEPQLSFFQEAGYDAILLGNHEFDLTQDGLIEKLRHAQKEMNITVPVLFSNAEEKTKRWGEITQDHLIKDVVFKRVVTYEKEKSDSAKFNLEKRVENINVRIGVIGTIGPDALTAAVANTDIEMPVRGMIGKSGNVSDFIDYVRKKTKSLREDHDCDIVILAMHGGSPEDVTVAKAVPELDAIISGHTHKIYQKYVSSTDVHIMQCGRRGLAVGKLEFDIDIDRKLHLRNPMILEAENGSCVKMTSDLPMNDKLLETISKWKDAINTVAPHNLNEVLYRGDGKGVFEYSADNTDHFKSVLLDGLRDEYNRYRSDEPVDFYMTCSDCIRDYFSANDDGIYEIGYSDVFRLFPLDFNSTTLDIYLHGKSFKRVLDIMGLIQRYVSPLISVASSRTMTTKRPETKCESQSNNEDSSFISRFLPFLKASEVYLHGMPSGEWPELVHMATNRNVGQFYFWIMQQPLGVLFPKPRDKDGNLITLKEASYAGAPSESDLMVQYLRRINHIHQEDK
eukprot:TRINITY_DN132777_c0_g1_i1.p1 TRINITY_DN132777_c0_g1~~TRINITY_DN132777_c0_g1_i1.p1  ORF type:complete len:646 (-),score=137.60 TRINITY_DN132777_c0_g1_i1:319-2208(-)